MDITIADVFYQLEESATLAINQNIKDLRIDGNKVYHLGFGESPFPVPMTVKEGLAKGENLKSYQPTQGIYELREAVAKFYSYWFNLHYRPEDIFIGPGSKELLFDLMLLIKGDLMLPVPSWVSYIPQAKIAGKKVIKVPTCIENSYCMTVEELKKAYNEAIQNNLNPKLLLINTPGNPCGNSYPENIVKSIVEFAREKELIIISDEIYANVTFKGHKHHSFAKFYPEGTFVTGGISKDRSLGGYRLGVCLIPPGQKVFKKAFNTLISETFSCVSAPIQIAAIRAYSTGPEMYEFIHTCKDIHNIALEYFYNQIIQSPHIECSPPMGAFYLYPKFKTKQCQTANHIVDILLNKYNVACLPSSCFGQDPGELNVRLAITDYSGSEAFRQYNNAEKVNKKTFIDTYCPNLTEAAKQIVRFASDYA
jgi:aspartate/methionine/tyrosine aminotransferase